MSRAATVRAYVPASRRPPAPGGGGAPGVRGRLLHSLRYAAPALSAYLAVRLCGLAVLIQLSRATGDGVWRTLAASWDSNWYLGIADHGYTDILGTRMNENNLAFFPLYPLLVKAFAAVSPGSRASVGLALAIGCSFIAAWGVFAVGARLYGRRTGTILTALWAALPVGVVQWMGYTESPFTALAAWALYAVLSGQWLWAGALASLAGLTRPTGIAVAAGVTVAAALAARRARPGSRWPAVTGAVIAPLGWLAFLAWVGHRVGRPDGYFAVQRLWKNEWDGGKATLLELRQQFVYASEPPLFLLLVSTVLILSAILFVLSVADRQPIALLVFSGVLLAVVLGSAGVYFPRARFLLPGFPLLLPMARGLARARRPVTVWVVLGAATLVSAWSGAYMLLVWQGPP
ncbi:glycosyltransferase family 39 protein [Streptomyces albipurpureus]|uniref:Glycosyltransferase family 39 protein n=1 Tax=Streptomyces albipurpureus TaxID=2897419 RepID=A0ABT0ULK5_9ACTN|nr:glycosyltransferase family 39 protein [Streptomyces sp. CWNU-1]MCM2389294.1 glycosyltransferase family 39 protein [Streptomyces sp. CWNU-1]